MLIKWIPQLYITKDAELSTSEQPAGPLRRFLEALDAALEAIHDDIAGLPDVISPVRCPEPFLDKILSSLGWTLPVEQKVKRELCKTAALVYRQKGTAAGVKNLIRLLVGMECEIVNAVRDPASRPSFYTFEIFPITPARDWAADEKAAVSAIVNYMKPAHTHFVINSYSGDMAHHWSLGESRLDQNAALH